jgi:hypothetical protein
MRSSLEAASERLLGRRGTEHPKPVALGAFREAPDGILPSTSGTSRLIIAIPARGGLNNPGARPDAAEIRTVPFPNRFHRNESAELIDDAAVERPRPVLADGRL